MYIPLYKPLIPSSCNIVGKACNEDLYFITLPNSPCNCIRTFTTSMGTVDNSAIK